MNRILLTAVSLFLCAGTAFSQDASGRVAATVTDPSGAVVVDAKVTVTEVATGANRSTVTDSDGIYQVLQVPIGTYRVAVEASGFHRVVIGDSVLRINETLRVDVKLEVGATTETVQVEAEAAGVETINATLGSSVTSRPITDMPLNGRDVLQLALLQPGVVPAGAGGSGTFSIAGARQDSITYLLDGVDPNPDTVAEFRILTSNYSAEYVRGGGGVLSVVTRSGTNDFHQCELVLQKPNRLPIDVLKRNQFGGTFSGPVTVPKVFNGKDKVFFLFGYQGQRLAPLQTTSKVTTYTPAELSGDFSHSSNGGPDKNVAAYLLAHPYYQPDPTLASRRPLIPRASTPSQRTYGTLGRTLSAGRTAPTSTCRSRRRPPSRNG
jgi:Carboxypeptidase regulatory-like domain